jgi:hypothetical protein
MAADSPTLFSEAIRSSRAHSRPTDEITFAWFLSEASQRKTLSNGHCRLSAPGKETTVSSFPPLSPKVGSSFERTFASGYGSDLLPLRNVFRIQVTGAVFHAGDNYGTIRPHGRKSGRLIPHQNSLFRCPDALPGACGRIGPRQRNLIGRTSR